MEFLIKLPFPCHDDMDDVIDLDDDELAGWFVALFGELKFEVTPAVLAIDDLKFLSLHGSWLNIRTTGSSWLSIAKSFIEQPLAAEQSPTEWYATYADEYGGIALFACTSSGHRLAFQGDQESEAVKIITSPEQGTLAQLTEKWAALVPVEVTKMFHDFYED